MRSDSEMSEMLFCDSGCPLINQLLCQQPGGWVAGIPGISWNSMDPEVPNEIPEVPNEVRLGHVGDVILPFWLFLNQSIALPAARGLASRDSNDILEFHGPK